MTNNRILQIIREEAQYQNSFILEGMTYTPKRGYRNNQLIEIHGRNRELLTEDWNSFAPKATAILDGLGIIPGIGELFNGISGLIKFSVEDVVGGAISFIGAIPFVGKILGAPFRLIHSVIGKWLKAVPKITKMVKGKKVVIPAVKGGIELLTDAFNLLRNGKMAEAAKSLLLLLGNLAKKAGGTIKAAIDKMYKFITTSASKINGGIDNIIPGIEAFIKKVTFGLVSGMPTAMKQALKAVFNQIKAFFTGLGSGKLYQTSKNVTKKVVTSNLTKKEEEAIKKKYNDGTVNKKDYPTLDDFIKKQISLKNKKEETVELKLWSKDTERVKKLQKILNIKVDGKFHDGTELAVKRWQKKNGLVPDGVVGPETWAKMT